MNKNQVMQRKDKLYGNINIQEKIEDYNARHRRKRGRWLRQLQHLLKGNSFTLIISVFTIIVLYADDIRVAFMPKSQDFTVDVVLCICFMLFLIELIAQMIALPDYMWSFFFWLDLISLMSIPIDIYFIIQYLQDDQIFDQTDDATNVARLSRSSKVGTKAGRYIKLIKMIRLIRVAKFFKQTKSIYERRQMMLQQQVEELKRQEQE